MALDACPECGGDLSEEVESCPHCGHELPDDGGAEPSPQPGWRSVGWALLFVLAIPAAILYQWTQDPGAERNASEFGPDDACAQFIKSRMPNPSATDVRVGAKDSLAEVRLRIRGRVRTGEPPDAPFTCVTTRREDGAWKLVELTIDSTSIEE